MTDIDLLSDEDMKIFATIKQLVTLKPVLMQFVLDKVYYRKVHHMHGVFYIQAHTAMDIASIQIEVTETLKISKETSETTVIGEKAFRKQLHLDRLEKYELDFDFPLKFPRSTKREHKTYKGDLGPLNKATDKSKKQLYIYHITAKVKIKGKKELLIYTETIKVE